ncbi:MAG: hypothetical protein L0332_07230 [Chloroflexi bacterium]|nr:hypothetical protein [Chloroflexota bacterium]MCI0574751.1 hypothetical protein [Chloroflexota bacterium]MCI0645680.1 hypothetical protein [Chloroflexota bacterium]MCI0726502.1 hypothetical protein [Chloroflexota bacterium]
MGQGRAAPAAGRRRLPARKELEPILSPLRRLLGRRLHILPVPAAARNRSSEERRAHRAGRYRAYFRDARPQTLSYQRLAVFPRRAFIPGQLLALEDGNGFALALGVVERVDTAGQQLTLYTPWDGQGTPAALRLGDLRLDLATFHDEPLF